MFLHLSNIGRLEKIQHRATRMVAGLSNRIMKKDCENWVLRHCSRDAGGATSVKTFKDRLDKLWKDMCNYSYASQPINFKLQDSTESDRMLNLTLVHNYIT